MGYLHVLNGDAAIPLFRDSGIEGDIIVCREIMCEGKVPRTDIITQFFEERVLQVEKAYGIDAQTYKTRVVEELGKLSTASDYEEVILWFDCDLFCQVNLLFIIFYLSTLPGKARKISCIQSEAEAPIPNYKGFGVLHASMLTRLFERRITLQQADFDLAHKAWEAYRGPDPLEIEKLVKAKSPALPLLGEALAAHLKRLPGLSNGLSIVEQFFLHRLINGKARWYDLYSVFWNEMRIYGFGDFQLDIYTQRMIFADLIERDDQMLEIKALGREMLRNEENYLNYIDLENWWLGGIHLQDSPWRYDAVHKKVVNIAKA
ncbi:hypothetical protein COR50_08545 [Chitinophaga caeni]|uniref:DUF1835 domain-containing protein n=1 Tax=Chitinophaga caeni TaxID=2029983 RepID=A0A291QTP6_9BACT|nr:hypothetical protein [Chitinophaga caeni]ATL47224.1 hypothetical protein COR50_08545 [Chitinophaga caeni]